MLVKSANIVPPTLVFSAHAASGLDGAGACAWPSCCFCSSSVTLVCNVASCARSSARSAESLPAVCAWAPRLARVNPAAIVATSILIRTRFSLIGWKQRGERCATPITASWHLRDGSVTRGRVGHCHLSETFLSSNGNKRPLECASSTTTHQEIRVTTMQRNKLRLLALATSLALGIGVAHATDITGAGSSFVYPVISNWSAAYAEKTGNRVNYQSIGSGGGIAQIKAGTVDFGASDMPLDEATLAKFGLGQFPDVIGGIVPAYNIAGIAPGKLVLDGRVLAKIFLGQISNWSDPAIAALNPDIALPSAKI